MNLFTLGGIMQMVGVAVVGYGALRTWHEFAPDESVWQPVTGAIAALVEWVRSRLAIGDRLRRRPRVTGTLHATARGGAFNARAVIGYAPLAADLDMSEALRQLDQRTRDISNRLAGAEGRLIEEGESIRDEIGRLQDMLDAQVVRLDAKGRRAATGGVRLSLFGGFLVAVGVFVQTFLA